MSNIINCNLSTAYSQNFGSYTGQVHVLYQSQQKNHFQKQNSPMTDRGDNKEIPPSLLLLICSIACGEHLLLAFMTSICY